MICVIVNKSYKLNIASIQSSKTIYINQNLTNPQHFARVLLFKLNDLIINLMIMALRRVDLSTDVYFVCLNHAMCTEGEEIVGLLVGEVRTNLLIFHAL